MPAIVGTRPARMNSVSSRPSATSGPTTARLIDFAMLHVMSGEPVSSGSAGPRPLAGRTRVLGDDRPAVHHDHGERAAPVDRMSEGAVDPALQRDARELYGPSMRLRIDRSVIATGPGGVVDTAADVRIELDVPTSAALYAGDTSAADAETAGTPSIAGRRDLLPPFFAAFDQPHLGPALAT